jgi:hypothetical protein
MTDRTGPSRELLRPFTFPATIDRGAEQSPLPCTVTAISERGARLSVLDVASMPDTFTLSFVGGTKVRRRCTVLSRLPGEIVVEMAR